ncbi:rhodanese domain protein [Aquipluma nitroreducens]|uniref:Rhodanese domain protein n=1 Tax=Aquipluma nitroreducens TaxID=2010828 RepID=A0A5K7SFC4_9BACT|nr:rhodanese-like domain-containing protein [Aquipluma nitroreducens]BBE20300.1 rhodanese domain protein [Aquipluma nitroreducens]
MERKYTILAVLLIVLALGLVVLPKKKDLKETDPKALLSAITEKSRYLSVDLVTHRIIENDPTLLLIDLRPANEFKAFALPGAINIQPDSLLSATTLELLNQPGKDKILYSNSDLMAEKAWLLGTRYSINRLYILKGGLNEWYNTIIKPGEVSSTASSADLDLMSFRNAARQYFTGAGQTSETPVAAKAPVKVKVIRKAPEAKSGGGC